MGGLECGPPKRAAPDESLCLAERRVQIVVKFLGDSSLPEKFVA